jgi:hypothetical protein
VTDFGGLQTLDSPLLQVSNTGLQIIAASLLGDAFIGFLQECRRLQLERQSEMSWAGTLYVLRDVGIRWNGAQVHTVDDENQARIDDVPLLPASRADGAGDHVSGKPACVMATVRALPPTLFGIVRIIAGILASIQEFAYR